MSAARTLLKAAEKIWRKRQKMPTTNIGGKTMPAFSRRELKSYIKRFGKPKTRTLISRGINVDRKSRLYDSSGQGIGMFGKELPFQSGVYTNPINRMYADTGGKKWRELVKKYKDSPIMSRVLKTGGTPPQIKLGSNPIYPQNWKQKTIKESITPGPLGGYNKEQILFYEPNLGIQFIVRKAAHKAKKSSGGFGGSKFKIPVGGKMVTLRGPWSSRGGVVRVHADPSFKGWESKSLRERYLIMKDLDLATKAFKNLQELPAGENLLKLFRPKA